MFVNLISYSFDGVYMKQKEILLFGASGNDLIRKLTTNNYKITAVTKYTSSRIHFKNSS